MVSVTGRLPAGRCCGPLLRIRIPTRRERSSDMSNHDSRLEVVGCRGPVCPAPIWRVRQALQHLAAGTEVQVGATEPPDELDPAVFFQRNGHELLHAQTREQVWYARLRVRSAPRSGAD